MISPHCLICGDKPKLKDNYQFYLKLTALENHLAQFFDERKSTWSLNAINMTQRYFNEGLIDRAISRDLDWGVAVPACDCPEKVIYNWAENVLGYLSACKEYCEKHKENFEDYFNNSSSKHYYIHAKDNIQFHSIIFPALLIANPNHYHLPDAILAYEFVTNDGQKISKSKGTDLSAKQLLAEFDVDFIRYYFAKNISDKRDLNFSKQEFINSVNGELINNWGNLVNRTLSFVKNKFNGKVKGSCVYTNIKSEIESAFEKVSQALEQGKVSLAVKEIFELVNFSNRFFNETEPWKVFKIDHERTEELCFQYLNLILNITILLNPIIPAGTNKIFKWLGLKKFAYNYTELQEFSIGEFEVLYQRI